MSALAVLRTIWTSVCNVIYNLFSCLWSSRAKPPDLNEDVCLVTGAGQGLGRQIALQLAADCGGTVVLWDIVEEKVREVEREIRDAGGTAHAYVVDCSDRKAVYRTAERVREDVGDVAVLVNNAAVVGYGSYVSGEVDDDTIERIFSVNTVSHYWINRAFLPWMMDNNYGYIVNIASLAAHVAVPSLAPYAASKAAVLSFSETLRYELILAGKRGVSVTCVCPSLINTGTTAVPQALMDASREVTGFILDTEDVARAILIAMGERKNEILIPSSLKYALIMLSIFPQKILDYIAVKNYTKMIGLVAQKMKQESTDS